MVSGALRGGALLATMEDGVCHSELAGAAGVAFFDSTIQWLVKWAMEMVRASTVPDRQWKGKFCGRLTTCGCATTSEVLLVLNGYRSNTRSDWCSRNSDSLLVSCLDVTISIPHLFLPLAHTRQGCGDFLRILTDLRLDLQRLVHFRSMKSYRTGSTDVWLRTRVDLGLESV